MPKKIIMASSDETKLVRSYVDTIVCAVAVAMERNPKTFSPFVSDLSAISDFCMERDEEGKNAFFEVVSRELGIVVERGDSMILDVAKRLMD